jgi:aquaglyceroporin related protein
MADSKPQRPRPYSTATGSSIRNCSTSHLGQLNSFRPQSERYNTALSNLCQMDTTHTNGASNIKQRLEKAQQQVIDIENEYFALNPWYNEQKEKPVFGLGQPLPHTIRRGMTWGRGDLKKLKEEEEDHGIDKRDGLDHEKSKYNSRDTGAEDFGSNDSYFSNPHARTGCHEDLKGSQVPLRGELPSQQSESTGDFYSTSQGLMANVRLPTTNTAYSVTGNRGNYHENQERAPVNEHGLTNSEAERSEPHRNHFGMQDGLHPLQELDSNETSQTQKEEKEIQQREHESQQEYYNQYRNPIARLRAQYPQAPAEFLAVYIINS